MDIWITTDTHIGHKRMAEEGWREPDYEEKVLRYHSEIPADSLLIHTGDVVMGKPVENHPIFMESIAHIQNKVLCKGNHDGKPDKWYLDQGWDFITKRFENKYFGKWIMFSHKPRPRRDGIDFQIHGHTHGDTHRDDEHQGFYDTSYHLELALENTGMRPVRLEKFLREHEHLSSVSSN